MEERVERTGSSSNTDATGDNHTIREAWGRGSLGRALSGIDHGWAGLEGPTRLHGHTGMSGHKLRASAG